MRGPIEHERRFLRVFALERFRYFRDRMNSFVLVSTGEEEGGGLLAATVLLLFRKSVIWSTESQEHALLQYMVMSRSIDTVHETLGCVFPR